MAKSQLALQAPRTLSRSSIASGSFRHFERSTFAAAWPIAAPPCRCQDDDRIGAERSGELVRRGEDLHERPGLDDGIGLRNSRSRSGDRTSVKDAATTFQSDAASMSSTARIVCVALDGFSPGSADTTMTSSPAASQAIPAVPPAIPNRQQSRRAPTGLRVRPTVAPADPGATPTAKPPPACA